MRRKHGSWLSIFLCLVLSGCSLGLGRPGAPMGPVDEAAPTSAGQSEGAQPTVSVVALIRRGESLRSSGRLSEAETTLEAALEAARSGEDERLLLSATGAWAALAIDLGRDADARELLEPALERARELDDAVLEAALGNELARLVERTDPLAAVPAYRAAADAAERAGNGPLALRALANAAHAAALGGSFEDARTLAARAAALGEREPLLAAESFAWLRLTHAQLIDLAVRRDSVGNEDQGAGADTGTAASTRSRLDRILAYAEAEGDRRVASHALGQLGTLAALEDRRQDAIELTWRALRTAQQVGDEELQARWHAQLARLAADGNDRDTAINHLAAATDLLARLRPALAFGDSQRVSVVMLDHVDERLYLEWVDALLSRAAEASDTESAQPDLRLAQSVLERFKAAELRDYFRDECVDAYQAKITDPATVSATAAVIYPVALSDRLVLLVSHAGEVTQFVVSVDSASFEDEVRSLRRWIVNRTRTRYRRHAAKLHDWIIDPIESHLEALGVDTLVFVPGGELRTVPMAALFDGDRYLIERYAIATIPGLELTDPKPINRDRVEVLLGGLSQARHGFPALEGVPEELAAVEREYGGTLLLDEGFEREAITEAFERHRYNIVHFATHAQFGSTPESSFLLAWDGPLGIDALSKAVGVFRNREESLDLLLLSACQTAAGDERAALGLAGVAVKAGARSALATLWSVGDRAAREVVIGFYRALREPGASRAEALRRAQRALLEDPALDHPADWAPFLMIGSWQ